MSKYTAPPPDTRYADVSVYLGDPSTRLVDIPTPHVRRYDLPDCGLRRVEVSLTAYEFGKHYYVRVSEEDNRLIAQREDGGLVELDLFGDSTGSGFSCEDRFDSEGDALGFLVRSIKENCNEGHQVVVVHARDWLIPRLQRRGISAQGYFDEYEVNELVND